MIANNFRKFPEAQLLQLELMLADEATAADEIARGRTGTYFAWLMNCGKVIELAKAVTPSWFAAMTRRAKLWANAVRAALMSFF